MKSQLPVLNRSQHDALNAVSAFVDSTTPVFHLLGSAGTGKTTLISHIISMLKVQSRPVALVAPTGRAARILGAKTGGNARTIHACIYALPKLDVFEAAQSSNDPGMRLFFPLKHDDPLQTVFIVDESSMVGDKESKGDLLRFGSGRLLSDLIEYARLGRIGRADERGAKIIFVGDPAQLPPVTENVSPALSGSHLKKVFDLESTEFELTEVMRQQAGSAVLDRATTLRDAISNKVFNTFKIAEEGDEIKDASIPKGVSIIEQAYHNKSSSVFITYSNAQSLKLNQAVRGRLWGNEKADIQTGDLLLVNKNSFLYRLSNGDLVKVRAVAKMCEQHSVRLKGEKNPVELMFRQATIVYRAADGTILQVDCRLLENLLHSPERELTPLEQRALLVDFRKRHHELKPGTEAFTAAILADPYFNALQVKYGYAMTCHKAQGGEWETAIVDFSGGQGPRSEGFFRWAYTAITRAKTRLVTISAPNFTAITGMKWGTRTQETESGVPGTSGNALTDDPDWNRLCFNTGQEQLFTYHTALRDAWEKAGITIERLDQLQYLQRYHIFADSKHASVQFNYKGNMKVSTITATPGVVSDPVLLEKALLLLEQTLASSSQRSTGLSDPFLEEFRNKLEQGLKSTGIRILSVEPMQYRLRIGFEESGHRTEIDFSYNGKKVWTSAQEVGGPGSSNGLIERVRQVMEEKA